MSNLLATQNYAHLGQILETAANKLLDSSEKDLR